MAGVTGLAHILRAQNFHASNQFDPERFSCEMPQAFLTCNNSVGWHAGPSNSNKIKKPTLWSDS